MSALVIVPVVLFIEAWLFLRTPRTSHSWRRVAVAVLGSAGPTVFVLGYSAWIHGGDPIAFIAEGDIVWMPLAAMLFLAELSLWEAFQRWRLPDGN